MKENINVNSINNNSENQEFFKNILKECPFCNTKLSLLEFEDHILCHEFGQNENGNLSNNINDFGIKKNVKKNEISKSESENTNFFGNIIKKVDNLFKSHTNKEEDNNKINNNNIITNSINNNITNSITNNINNNINNNIDDNNNINNINNNTNLNTNNNNENNSVLDTLKNKKNEINNKLMPIFSKVKNFFVDLANKSNDDSDSDDNDYENFNNNLQNLENLVNIITAVRSRKKDDSQEILKYIPNSIVKEVKKPEDKL